MVPNKKERNLRAASLVSLSPTHILSDMAHNVMIIYSNIKSKYYRNIILDSETGFRGGEVSRGILRCPNRKCRCDKFYRHGIYERYFITLSETQAEMDPECSAVSAMSSIVTVTEKMQVLRVSCAQCRMTHAVLPSDVIPYHQHSYTLILFILSMIFNSENCDNAPEGNKLHQTPEFIWSFLNALVRAYRLYKDRMISALRFDGLYHAAENPSDIQMIRLYLGPPSQNPCHIAFIRIHQCQIFVTRRDTISSPIRYIFPKS